MKHNQFSFKRQTFLLIVRLPEQISKQTLDENAVLEISHFNRTEFTQQTNKRELHFKDRHRKLADDITQINGQSSNSER